MNILIVYPRPDKQKKPRFGFSYELLTIATVLSQYHKIIIKDYSCEEFDSALFIEEVKVNQIDLALIECDSYALKRSQNIIHAKEIINMLSQNVTTIAYGNYCYIKKDNFDNAHHTIIVNDINEVIKYINYIDKTETILLIKDYDSIPHLDRNLLQKIPYYKENAKNTLLQTSKGCENTCIFCQRKGWQSCYIAHSDDYVLEEIRELKSEGYENIWITDENFTFNLSRAKRLLKKMIDGNLVDNMRFFISSWANIDKEFLDLAKDSNIRIISFGIESGSNEILKFYRKNINIEKVPTIIQYANSIGIFTVGNFIIGAPMENEETIEKTFKLIQKCEFDQINIKNLDYMIGSALYDSLDEVLKTEDHVFACKENGLNKFAINEIVEIKNNFIAKYYKIHRESILKKINKYGTPF